MPAIIQGIPAIGNPIGGFGNSKVGEWVRCDSCGFSYRGDACAFPNCSTKRPVKAAEVAAPPARSSAMLRLERAAKEILCTDKPIYCLWRFELPAEFILADACMGLTGMSIDLAVREHIANWEGRGRAVVFNGPLIVAEFDSVPEGLNQVLVHELSHIAAGGFAADRDAADPDPDFEVERGFSEIQMRASRPLASALDYFDQHDAAFFRALMHVTARAYELDLDFNVCGEHERCGLSDAGDYYAALRDEIAAFDGLPLVEALRSVQPPQEYLDLFASDVARVRGAYQYQ